MALRGALTHRKTRWLAEALNIKLPYALGLMEALWHLTSEQTPTGAIGELSDKAIAAEMYWDDDPAILIDALVKSEIIDRDPKYRLIVHGWAERADQTTKRKVARSGKSMVGCDAPKLDMASQQLDAYSLPEPEPEPETPLTPQGDAAGVEKNGTRTFTDDERHRFDWETVEQFLGRTLNHRRDWEPFLEQRRICEQRGFPLGPKFIRELAEEKLAEFEAKKQRPRYVTPLVEAMRDAVDEIAGGRLVLR